MPLTPQDTQIDDAVGDHEETGRALLKLVTIQALLGFAAVVCVGFIATRVFRI